MFSANNWEKRIITKETRIEPATSNNSSRQTDLLENHRQFPTLGAHETNE
jgi:hypothetical protein